MKYKIGDKIGRLTILDIEKRKIGKHTRIYCYCECKCGNHIWARMDALGLEYGKTQSCKCYRKEISHIINSSHISSETTEYNTWIAMKERCLNPKSPNYHLYGGRGIKICDRWLHSFENFLEDMGHKPNRKYSIERIDVDGNYEPSNCKWATNEEQQNNKRNSVKVSIDGKNYSVKQLAEKYSIKESRIRNWKRRNKSIPDMLNKIINK